MPGAAEHGGRPGCPTGTLRSTRAATAPSGWGVPDVFRPSQGKGPWLVGAGSGSAATSPFHGPSSGLRLPRSSVPSAPAVAAAAGVRRVRSPRSSAGHAQPGLCPSSAGRGSSCTARRCRRAARTGTGAFSCLCPFPLGGLSTPQFFLLFPAAPADPWLFHGASPLAKRCCRTGAGRTGRTV